MIAQSLANMALFTILYQTAFFTIAYLRQIDTVTDFAGTTNILLLTVHSLRQCTDTRCRIAASFVIVWALRLGIYLLYRILQWGHDKRFDSKRADVRWQIFFWVMQAMWVWIVILPITLLSANAHTHALGGLDVFGWAIFTVGFMLESVADWQKWKHKQKEGNVRWVNGGLWRFSRHPNYLGEIMVWFGVYVSCMSGLQGMQHMAVMSPLFVTWLLLFLSGIPLLEHNADRKHGRDEEYLEYKKSTSVLFLCAPAVYRRLPRWLKRTAFLELDRYDNTQRIRAQSGEEEIKQQ